MRDTPAGLLSHVQTRRVTTLAICWRITKKNGEIIRGTEHDRDIEIASGDYAGTYLAQFNITGSDIKSGSDMSVDNMDVEGAVQQVVNMSMDVADIESGVMDNCPVVVFQVNWAAPNDGQQVIRAGYVGQIFRDSNGKYKTEVRGLLQKLSQQIGQNYSEECNVVRFGDERCGFDLSTITQSCTVVSVTDRKRFTAEIIASPAVELVTLPRGGEVQWTSGDNAGFEREVKTMTLAGGVFTIELFEESAADIEVGDTVDVVPGCDRLLTTCRFTYDNLVNFRGYGVFVPGALAIMRGNSLQGCVVPEIEPPEFPEPPDEDDESPATPPITPDPPDEPPPPLPGGDDSGGPVDGILGSPDFIIPASMQLFDGSNALPVTGPRRRVHGGDLIEIAQRNGSTLTIKDVVGESDNYIYIRGPQDGSQAIIRRVTPQRGGDVFKMEACRYFCIDGYSASAPVSGDGRRYALKWMYARNASNTNRDAPVHFIKGLGIPGRGTKNLTDNFIIRNFEIDGGWFSSGPRFSDGPGIGVSTNHIKFKARDFPGQYQENMIFEHFYLHNLEGEGTYIGANPYLSYRHEGGRDQETLGADLPLRHIKIRYGTGHDCGGNMISGKSWFGGTAGEDGPTHNSVHDIRLWDIGFDPEANGTGAIGMNSCNCNVYNIWGRDVAGAVVSMHISDGTPSNITFDFEVYNIVAARAGGNAVFCRQGAQDGAPTPPPRPRVRTYNCTIVDAGDQGIVHARVQPGSFIRNSIVLDSGGTDVNPGEGTQAGNLTTGNPNTIFVDANNDDYHLAAAQPTIGVRGVDYAFKDIEGNDRPSSGADKGAYERA